MSKTIASVLFIVSIYLSLSTAFAIDQKSSKTPDLKPIENQQIVNEDPPSLIRYLQLLEEHPDTFGPFGKWENGEIEVITQTKMIKRIQKQTQMRLMANGISEAHATEWSSVGIVAEDNYWIWIRDAVIFPSGVYGTYDRMMWKHGIDGPPGVAILPLLSTKKIIVNVNYRHATRSWEIELPRGQKKIGESIEKAAARELEEETGYQIGKCTLLGVMPPDSGMVMGGVPIFCAEVSYSGESYREFSEAIATNPAFTQQELREGFGRGFIEVFINGRLIKANCRDPFLAYALLQADFKHLFSP